MREHMGLFRGKRIDNGEWEYGNLIISPHYGEKCVMIERRPEYMNRRDYAVPMVDPDTIGECTGLKDKNGKLIFEGDILRVELGSKKYKYRVNYYGPFAMFMLDDSARHCGTNGMYTQLNECEIIGTVHDNPELLEGGEGE